MTHTDPTTRRVPSWKTKRSSRRRRRGRKEDRVVNICVNAERDASFVPTIEPVVSGLEGGGGGKKSWRKWCKDRGGNVWSLESEASRVRCESRLLGVGRRRRGERRTGSKENGFTRQSLSGRPRENHNAKPPPFPLLVSLLVLPSDRPFARLSLSLLTSVRQVCPPVHPIVSSSASCHSPRQPLPTLLSHQEFISSPVLCLVLLLRCSFCSLLRPLFLLLVTTVVILVPPQLFLSFPISPDFFKILSSGSLERDRNRDREIHLEGWILESSAYHMRNEHYSHSGTLRTRTISWMGFRECGGGKGARKGREKGCWKRAELGVHRWSALGPLLGSGPIPTDPRMPFASRGPPVVVFLVLVVDAVILAILSSPSSLREREGLPSNRSRPSGGLWLEGPWTAPGRERQWTMGT